MKGNTVHRVGRDASQVSIIWIIDGDSIGGRAFLASYHDRDVACWNCWMVF